MITSLSNNQNISFTGAGRVLKSFHLSPQELDALRKEKSAKETLFAQGNVGDCYLIATLKSTMFSLNEYANKTGKQSFNARNWLRKLVKTEPSKYRYDRWTKPADIAKIAFPLPGKTVNKVEVSDGSPFGFSEGNIRIGFLECAYGILTRTIDAKGVFVKELNKVLNGGYPFLSMRDITGLKSIMITNQYCKTEEQRELYKKNTAKLFKKFKEHPENLVITIDSKANNPYAKEKHCLSLKKVTNQGLIIVDPHSKTNEEIKVSFKDFYEHFDSISFARLRPEKMFKMIKEAKRTKTKTFDMGIFHADFGDRKTPMPIRNSQSGEHLKQFKICKNNLYYTVLDKLN